MRFAQHKASTLRTKKTLDFISRHPEGATIKDFRKVGLYPHGVGRLITLDIVIATQVREPKRGPRGYHWLWKLNKKENYE